MRDINVPAVYVVEDRIKGIDEQRRLERMLKKIDSDVMFTVSEEKMRAIILEQGWYSKSGRTGEKRVGYPNIIFSGFDWDDPLNDIRSIKDYHAFVPGRFRFADFRDCSQLRDEKGVVCNSGYEIHSAFGCLHACDYCHVGNAFTVMLNIEELAERVETLMGLNPWQRLYKYDNQSDINFIEPEYGATECLMGVFSRTDNYLMLYTKSDNVDYLLDLDHQGHTVVSFTMSSQASASNFEKGTPSLYQRLFAASKCQNAGYPLRIRFSPIIPTSDWKDSSRELVTLVMSNLRPDVVCMEMLCHMDWQSLHRCMDTEKFDSRFLEGGRSLGEYELFSHGLRREVYDFFISEIRKWNKDVDIALCLETPEMWDEFVSELNGNKNGFRCCCGAKCTPK